MSAKGPITEKDLGAILAAEKADALASMRASVLSNDRTDALNYYLGQMTKDMPTVEGRSSAVSTDVSDTIEGMLPDLMEIFAGGEEAVKFKPVGPEDMQAAEQETQFVNHEFLQKNPGFMVTYTFLKDGLLSKVGLVKVYWEDETREESETFLDQSDDVFALLSQSPDAEITEHTAHDGLHDFTVVNKKKYGCCRVVNVPPEEFGIARRARVINGASQSLDASYCFHEVSRYESDLIAEGYDADQVKSLPTYGKVEKTEEMTRDTVAEGAERSGDSALNTAMRSIRVTEHYIKMDYEKAGSTKLYRVTTGGEDSTVLRLQGKAAVEPVDWMPFAAWCPVPMTHRFFGRSIAELVMDIQRIKTALLRALLDNAYLANNPRTEISDSHAGDSTLDDLLVSRPGGIVRTKQPGGLNILQHPDIGAHVYPLMQYMDSNREWKTGITKQGMGLDADALNNQTATAAQQLYTAAKARLRMIARIFAETGYKDMFWLMHATIRKHGQKAETVQLENNWVTIDPRQWKSRKDMTVQVGLGTGDKQQQLQQLTILATQQKEALAGGLSNLVTPANLYNTAKQMCKLLGLPATQLYFTDPATQPPPQTPPDPKMMAVQMKAQIDQQMMQARLQHDQQQAQLKAQTDQQQAQQQLALNTQKVRAEMARDQQKHDLQLDIMMRDHAAKQAEHNQQLQMAHEQHRHKITEAGVANGAKGGKDDRFAEIAKHLTAPKKVTKHVNKDGSVSWIAESVH